METMTPAPFGWWESINLICASSAALFKKFCKRDFCDEVRDFKIPEPEAVAS